MTQRSGPIRYIAAMLPALAAVILLVSCDDTASPENTGPNASIVRWAEGEYSYRTLSDGRERGWERFHMAAHPDGSRTMMMWHDLAARNAQFTVMLRVAENFRPLHAYLSYWVEDGYKGSTTMIVNDDSLHVVSNGPAGTFDQVTSVPDVFSLGTHPVSADGWHMWGDTLETEVDQTSTIYSLEAANDLDKPPLGMLRPLAFKRLGEETIEVPAGIFDTIHYDLSGSEIWVTKEDRLMVRMRNERFDREYILTSFAAGTNRDEQRQE